MRVLVIIGLLVAFSMSAYASNAVVGQTRTAFTTEEVTVKAGETVTFTNTSDVTHNIQIMNDKGQTDDRGLQKSGQDIPVTFAKTGIFTVLCNMHPKMKMRVKVE